MVKAVATIGLTVIAVPMALLFFACGGAVERETPADACSDASAHEDAADEEAAPSSWWLGVFDDASIYSGFGSPVVGEYPPSGRSACIYSGCFVEGTCDPATGWCCSGREKEGQCVCGGEAGCVPPSVCCALPGALVLQCVATPVDCPDAG
jgi:hypothetical protein